MTRLQAFGLCAALLAGLVTPAIAGETRSLGHQDVERLFLLHNAEAAAVSPAPLIVFLHGFRKKDEMLAAGTDLSSLDWGALNRVAKREGFVVAYPAARLGQWNLFDGLRNTALEDGRPQDDVGFIFAVIQRLIDEGLADPQRVYLSGFSDGAIMSYRLLCLAATPFAAAAPMGGTMYQKHRDHCAANAPPPLLVIAGTNDRILPYDGWIFRNGREVSIPETMEHFRLLHGCSGQEAELREDREPGDGSRVREIRWTGCAQEGVVVLLRVEGGGHTRPSYDPVSDDWRERAGGHNHDIESPEEVSRLLSLFRQAPPGE